MVDNSERLLALLSLLEHVSRIASDALITLKDVTVTQALLDDLHPKLAHLKRAAEAVVAALSSPAKE